MADARLTKALKQVKKRMSKEKKPHSDQSLEALVRLHLEEKRTFHNLSVDLQHFFYAEILQKAKDANVVKILKRLYDKVEKALKSMTTVNTLKQIQSESASNLLHVVQSCGELVGTFAQRYQEKYASAREWVRREEIVSYFETVLMGRFKEGGVQTSGDLYGLLRLTCNRGFPDTLSRSSLALFDAELKAKSILDAEFVQSNTLTTINAFTLPLCLQREIQISINAKCNKLAVGVINQFFQPVMEYSMKASLTALCAGSKPVLSI